MIRAEFQLAYCTWLGAVVDRLRHGDQPFSLDPDEVELRRDQGTFGVPANAWGYNPLYEECPCPPDLRGLYVEMADRVRGTPIEAGFWGTILVGPWVPPDSVIEDLLARDIETDLIGHLPLSDPRLWKLADLVPEALLTLAKRRYLGERYDQYRFQEVLKAYPTHEWMLSSLPELTPSHPTKAEILVTHLRSLPDPEQYTRYQSKVFEEIWSQGE